MSGLDSNSVNLGPGITTPVSGNAYSLNSLAFSHWLDNSGSQTDDGNPILAWQQDTPAALNQEASGLYFPLWIDERIKAHDEFAVGISHLPEQCGRNCLYVAISKHNQTGIRLQRTGWLLTCRFFSTCPLSQE